MSSFMLSFCPHKSEWVKGDDMASDEGYPEYAPIAEQLAAGAVFKPIWKAPEPWQFK